MLAIDSRVRFLVCHRPFAFFVFKRPLESFRVYWVYIAIHDWASFALLLIYCGHSIGDCAGKVDLLLLARVSFGRLYICLTRCRFLPPFGRHGRGCLALAVDLSHSRVGLAPPWCHRNELRAAPTNLAWQFFVQSILSAFDRVLALVTHQLLGAERTRNGRIINNP